jgi:two-component system, response regulator
MADDDEDDRMFAREAFELSRLNHLFIFVENGKELMDYLLFRGKYEGAVHERPALILLDLNMPLMDGREVLHEIKQHPELKYIPVVVFSGSSAMRDIQYCYALGANSFIVKPANFSEFLAAVQGFIRFWLQHAELPGLFQEYAYK